MAFEPGLNSRYYVGPQRFSVFGKSLNCEVTCNQLDASSTEDVAQVYVNGQKNGSASIEMMLDTAYVATSQFTTLNTWQTTPQPVTVGFSGGALGSVAWMLLGNQSAVTFGSSVGDLVSANVTIQPDGGIDWGQVIAIEAAITADGNGTAVDNGAASANGGVAHIHSTAFSGLTSNDVRIEHSVNGSTSWATLATFTQVTGVGSERVVVAPGTAVRQYLRVVDDVTGTGSHTRFITFARR
jgi:hypothetical protein